jgi:hypothetical protein
MFVIVMSRGPAVPAGMVMDSVLALIHDTAAVLDPTFTVAVASKFVPLTVTVSPPVFKPEFGEALLTVGAAAACATVLWATNPSTIAISATLNITPPACRIDLSIEITMSCTLTLSNVKLIEFVLVFVLG